MNIKENCTPKENKLQNLQQNASIQQPAKDKKKYQWMKGGKENCMPQKPNSKQLQ